ncbi:hypothetical protein RDI58_016981 [Solanum bulbocastanum]|uniref:Uncharacterized protein n=1 Tax=Solanum bulbocastanum TaxID=147425 RepID=A0AAN8TE55_SOLBU
MDSPWSRTPKKKIKGISTIRLRI